MQPGDVVVYRKGDGYIVHRVHSVHPEGMYTRGDNNPIEMGTWSRPSRSSVSWTRWMIGGKFAGHRGENRALAGSNALATALCTTGFCPGWELLTAGLSAPLGKKVLAPAHHQDSFTDSIRYGDQIHLPRKNSGCLAAGIGTLLPAANLMTWSLIHLSKSTSDLHPNQAIIFINHVQLVYLF